MLYLFHHVFPVLSPVSISETAPESDFGFAFRGFGQVVFQGSILSGIIFFIAVFIQAPLAALYAIAASLMAAILAHFFLIPGENIQMGLYSYNAVLCAIVFAGVSRSDGIWVVIAVILAVLIGLFMDKYQFTQLTFLFVAATWLTLLLKRAHKHTVMQRTKLIHADTINPDSKP